MSSSPSDAKSSESNARQKQLNKSFALLKTHATRVAIFTLQWQELEDHFRQINSLIDTTFQHISTADKGNRLLASGENIDGTAHDSPASPPGLSGIPVTDGTSLMLFVRSHRCENDKLRAGLCNTLKRLENPGKLVLESLRAYRGVGSKFSIFRKCCVIVLEAFMKVRANVGAQEKEEAMEMALKWKAFMKTETGCWGILGFLMILAGFGLICNFDADEIFKLFDSIVKRKDAPGLLKALGFVDRVPDLIGQLISQNKRLIAINYIYAFELVDKFPPIPLLKDHAKCAKEVTESVLKDRSNPVKDQHMAVNREIVALKAIRVILQSRELLSEYPVAGLKLRLEKLLHKGRELHAAELSEGKHQGKKRGRKKGNDPHPSKKGKLTTTQPSCMYPHASAPIVLASNPPEIPPFTVPAENPSYPQSARLFSDQGAWKMTSSARVDSERTSHNSFVGEVSTFPGKQPFPHRPPDMMPNQVGASHFGYNRIGTPTRFSPHTNSAVGPYSSLDTAPSNSHAHYSLSAGQYERNYVATNSNGHREGRGLQVYNEPSSYFCDVPGGSMYHYTRPTIPNNAGNDPGSSNSIPTFYHHPGTEMTSGHYGARYGASPSRPPFTYHL